jgi:3-phosphoshikimate 1-carboxyvinyltransferase
MGADIVEENRREHGWEAVADLRVRHAPLHGIELPLEIVADMIDEFPVLFVAAAFASGETLIEGVGELRVKESDRLGAMSRALSALGIEVEEGVDSLRIYGGGMTGGGVHSRGDHRIAMAFAVAAQMAAGSIRILDCANADTSFPGFVPLMSELGFGLRIESGR